MIVTPYMIEIILHYHWSNNDEAGVGTSPATDEACEFLVSKGILKRCPEGFKTKYMGNRDAIQVYIDKLISIPLPTMKWTIEHGEQ